MHVRRLAITALFLVAAAACRRGAPTSLQEITEPGGSGGFHALWPEHTLEAGMQAQARTDAGGDIWRLDPAATAERFARRLLGRDEVLVRTCPFEQDADCGPGDSSRPDTSFLYLSWRSGSSDLIVRLDRLVRPGAEGIWSVSWVGDAGKDLPAAFERPPGVEEDPSAEIGPGGEIRADAAVWVRSARPDVGGVVAGYVYWGPCQTEGFAAPVRRLSVFLEFEVATRNVGESCPQGERPADGSSLGRPVDGVIFIATTRSDSYIDPARLGVWLFDPPRRTPETDEALEQIVDVAAMPVRFVPTIVSSAAPSDEPAASGLGSGEHVGPLRWAFYPGTYPEGPWVVMPVTFPGGSRAELLFGEDLRPQDLGVTAVTSGGLGGVDRDMNLLYGDGSGIMGSGPLRAYDGHGGGTVEVWDSPDESFPCPNLVYRFGAWFVGVRTCQDDLSEVEEATWARSLIGQESEDSFLVLEALLPLQLTPTGGHSGPQLWLQGESSFPFITVIPRECDPNRPGGEEEASVMEDGQLVSFHRIGKVWYADLCAAAKMTIHVESTDQEYVEAAARSLRVRNVTEAEE